MGEDWSRRITNNQRPFPTLWKGFQPKTLITNQITIQSTSTFSIRNVQQHLTLNQCLKATGPFLLDQVKGRVTASEGCTWGTGRWEKWGRPETLSCGQLV